MLPKWIHNKFKKWWQRSPGVKQAKERLTEPQFTRHLLNKDRKTAKIIAGLLTAHCKLTRHIYNKEVHPQKQSTWYVRKNRTVHNYIEEDDRPHKEGKARGRLLGQIGIISSSEKFAVKEVFIATLILI